MNALDKFKKHVGRSVKFKLANPDGTEDEFELKQMSIETFTEFMLLSERLDQLNKSEMPNKDQHREMVKEIFGIYKKIVMESYPEIDEETAQNFIIQNFPVIIGVLNDIMPVKISEEDKQILLQKVSMFKNVNEGQNTQPA